MLYVYCPHPVTSKYLELEGYQKVHHTNIEITFDIRGVTLHLPPGTPHPGKATKFSYERPLPHGKYELKAGIVTIDEEGEIKLSGNSVLVLKRTPSLFM